MPVPTLVTDLSTTVASNSPSGSDNVFPDLDNYLRALSGFVASIRDNSGNGWVSPYLPLTYSAGTANGVVYLNGSKVVTTGSGLVFDGSNLGLGVTPSAWGNLNKALQLSGTGAVSSTVAGNTASRLSHGAYFDNTNWRYTDTSIGAARYEMTGANAGSTHAWYVSAGGTAGNAISFTQAMTLDASGQLGIGVNNPSERLDINGNMQVRASGYLLFQNSDNTNYYYVQNTGATGSGNPNLLFVQGGVGERARITSGGNLLVGTTADAGSDTKLTVKNTTAGGSTGYFWNASTSGDSIFLSFGTEATITTRGSIDYNRAGGLTRYNTTSDYRAKDIIGPVQNSGATIDALKVYEGRMKGATQSRPMLIAHEAQEHVPFCVSGEKDEENPDGSPKFQQMDHASLVPLLLAEIQSLRARVAALEQA